ncbi:MAG: helix-turn-helix transcriptional regulator [Bacteroidales bacterium]|nr:helix-turn-helix transcriptional regulator [Bacteroidales bacterium]
MLETGKYRISEVAYDVGFSDPKYFSTCFSKQFNKTPSEYVRDKNT